MPGTKLSLELKKRNKKKFRELNLVFQELTS